MTKFYTYFTTFLIMGVVGLVAVQPVKSQDQTVGEGPFDRLVIRGVTLVDGTGSPPRGPVDIVIEDNRITSVQSVGYPGVPIDEGARPMVNKGTKVLEAKGMYLLPGFIDMHAHTHKLDSGQGTPPEYIYKLWMAHGITSVREAGSFSGMDWFLSQKERSKKNEIIAPRYSVYVGFGLGHDGPITTPEEARQWVQMIAEKGADGIKFFGTSKPLYKATIEEANKLGLGTMTHHAQTRVVYNNALESARLGLESITHWYGVPEALFTDQKIQDYPMDYNYNNEQNRFEEAGKLWKQAAKPYSDKWNSVMNEMLVLGVSLNPTFTAYVATRNLMAQRRAEWHQVYTLPSLWEFYKPNRVSHGSYWFNWGTEQEIAWKENYDLWFEFINEFKNRGGNVTIGGDAGYTYNLYGFGYIKEMELFREAGFHPLEIFQAASLNAAKVLEMDDQLGTIEVGKLADMVLVDANPLKNLKTLYGTGAIKLNENNEPVRIGGIEYTIKDGIIYDAKKLLKDVAEMVEEAKQENNYKITQPGLDY